METISQIPVSVSPELSLTKQAKRNAMEAVSQRLQTIDKDSPSVVEDSILLLETWLIEVRNKDYKKEQPLEKWAMEGSILKLKECLELELKLEKETEELRFRQGEINQLFPGLKWLLKAAHAFGGGVPANEQKFLINKYR